MDVQLQSSPQISNFQIDIINGLTQKLKKLSSRYFYDKKGDALFQQIMNMTEYYLSKCELDIFKNKTAELTEVITSNHDEPFDLIELGTGDASKSTYLLRSF